MYLIQPYGESPPLNCFPVDRLDATPVITTTPTHVLGSNPQIEEIQTIRVSSEPILYLAYNHDGSQLAAATNGQVWIFDSDDAERTELKEVSRTLVRGLAFNPVNDELAVFGGHITIWDTQNYRRIKQIDEGFVESVAYTDDGTQLIFLTIIRQDTQDERQLQIWSTKNYSKDATIKYPHLVDSFAMTPFENCAVVKQRMLGSSGAYDMALLDLTTGGWKLFNQQNESIHQVDVSPDGKTIASFSRTGLSLWNTVSGERLQASVDSNSYMGMFYKQGRLLIVLDIYRDDGHKGSIALIDVASGQKIAEIMRNQADLTNIVIHPNQEYFATSTNDGQVIIWNIRQQ